METQQEMSYEEAQQVEDTPLGQAGVAEQYLQLVNSFEKTVSEGRHRVVESPARDSKFTEVWCLDEPGQGGACHHYVVVNKQNHEILSIITFQNGPIQEVGGVNGGFQEDLLAIVHDRLDHFAKGDYATRENALAKTDVEAALLRLHQRTLDRERRAVINTNQK